MKHNYAEVWQRFVAALIDGLIVGVVPSMIFKNNAQGINFLISLAYNVWMLGYYGQTVGMMVMHIKILKENGKKVVYTDALIRYFASILSAIALFIGYLWMIWDAKRQTWHDKLAHTVVVKA